MAQQADGEGKTPWSCGILASESDGTTALMGALVVEISLGNGGKT